jgi:hypothetical protein
MNFVVDAMHATLYATQQCGTWLIDDQMASLAECISVLPYSSDLLMRGPALMITGRAVKFEITPHFESRHAEEDVAC